MNIFLGLGILINLHLPFPDAQCMVYLPTFGLNLLIGHTLSIWDDYLAWRTIQIMTHTYTFLTIFVDIFFVSPAWIFKFPALLKQQRSPWTFSHFFFTKTSPAKTPLQKGCFAMNLCKQVAGGEKNASRITPLKFNMEPENTPLEKENHLPNHHFRVLC